MSNVVCNALWIGTRLGPLYAACLRSFLTQGHRVILHAYDVVEDCPQGVEIEDANHVIDRTLVFKHRVTGSFAAFSDRFRLALMQQQRGVYIDCDVLCVRPLPEREYLIGREDRRYLNGAVLRLPPSELLNGLLESFDGNKVPRWVGPKEWLRCNYRLLRFGGSIAENLSWGYVGPKALTHWVKQLGLDQEVLPASAFYPVHWTEVPKLLAPDTRIEDVTSPNTYCVHLYNEVLSKIGYADAPATSIVGRLLAS